MFIAGTDELHWRVVGEGFADAVRTGQPRPQAVFDMPGFDYDAKNVKEGEQFGRAMENVSGLRRPTRSSRLTISTGSGPSPTSAAATAAWCWRFWSDTRRCCGIVCDLPYIQKQANSSASRPPAPPAGAGFEAGDFFEARSAGSRRGTS